MPRYSSLPATRPTSRIYSAISHDLRGVGTLQQFSGDDHALDFAGAFVNGQDAGVAVHALHRGLTGIADTAVDLHGFGGYPIGHFARIKFCFACGGTER